MGVLRFYCGGVIVGFEDVVVGCLEGFLRRIVRASADSLRF